MTAVGLFTVSLGGCGDDAGLVCISGASVSCIGPDGCAGGQSCNAAGTGYNECVCGTMDAGTDGITPDVRTDVASDVSEDTTSTDVIDAGRDANPLDAIDADVDAGPDDAGPVVTYDCDPLTGEPCTGSEPRCGADLESLVFSCEPEGHLVGGDDCDGRDDQCISGSICIGTCAELCDPDAPDCPAERPHCGRLEFVPEEPWAVCVR